MTITSIRNQQVSGSTKKVNNDQMELKQGDIMEGTVVSLSDTSLSISVDNSDQVLDLSLDKAVGLDVRDRVEVEVLKADAGSMELSVKKLEESNEELTRKTNASINIMDVKRAVLESETPLAYSKQLDQHIQEAMAKVGFILETFTSEELKGVVDLGLDPRKMTIDLLYQVGQSRNLDKRISLADDADRSVQISVDEAKISELIDEYGDKHPLQKIDKEALVRVIGKLQEASLPTEVDQFEKVQSFSDKVAAIKSMKTTDMISFLNSDKASTIKELYKSIYIGNKKEQKNVITPQDFNQIEDQVNQWVDEYFEVSDGRYSKEELKDIAKNLVMKGVPLDSRTLDVIQFVHRDFDVDQVEHIAIEQMKKMEKPDDYVISDNKLSSEWLAKDEVRELQKTLHKTNRQVVEKVAGLGKIVSLKELSLEVAAMEERGAANETIQSVETANQPEPLKSSTDEVKVIDEAMKDIQILRFKMTYKAALSLNIKGVDLKNENVSVIREHIEQIEQQSVSFLSADNNGDQQSTNVGSAAGSPTIIANSISYVSRQLSIISSAPASSIAEAAIDVTEHTIDRVVEVIESSKTYTRLSSAANAYDQLRTEVRRDLGDRIEEAFANVDDILEDMDLETSTFNRRAVEILGRTERPITHENIEAVKALDMQLQELTHKLLPNHIVEMVELGVDITNEPIENVLAYLQIKESDLLENPSESIAKELLHMDKLGLPENEREALLGVFRMIHTIEASKGAAVGMMLDRDMDVTLENLFDVAKVVGTQKTDQPTMYFDVSDDTGLLESISTLGQTIKEQIRNGFFEKNLEVGRLMDIVRSGEMTMNESGTSGDASESSEFGSNTEVLNLHEQMKAIKDQVRNQDVQVLRQTLEELKVMSKPIHEKAIQNGLDIGQWNQLEKVDGQIGLTKSGFSDMIQWMNDEELSSLRGLMDQFLDEVSEEGARKFQAGLEKVIDQALVRKVDEFMDSEDVDNKDLLSSKISELNENVMEASRNVRNQAQFNRQMIQDEDYYTLPVMVNGQVQEMNMYYFRDQANQVEADREYSVYFSITTVNMGTTNMKVDIGEKNNQLTMFATNDRGNREIKAFEDAFRDVFSGVGLPVQRVNYDTFQFPRVIQKKDNTKVRNQIRRYNSQFENMA